LGSGTFGEVYKCLVENTDYYAIKVLQCDENSVNTYLLEAKALFQLQHENVLKIHEQFMYQEYFCIVTDLCDSSLVDWKGKISKDKFRTFYTQLIDGLAYIHSKKFIHRDIKPDNLFVRDDKLIIGDFGVAKKPIILVFYKVIMEHQIISQKKLKLEIIII